MFNGKIVCIGSSQQLKEKYSLGFDIHVKIRPNNRDEISNLKKEITSALQCQCSDESSVSF